MSITANYMIWLVKVIPVAIIVATVWIFLAAALFWLMIIGMPNLLIQTFQGYTAFVIVCGWYGLVVFYVVIFPLLLCRKIFETENQNDL